MKQEAKQKLRLAVLVTCYNRVTVSEPNLRSLNEILAGLPGVSAEFFVTDDGSKDGTLEALQAIGPNFHVVKGSGQLYWTGGMRKAHAAAVNSKTVFDVYLLFNDDVAPDPRGVRTALSYYLNLNSVHPQIIVGHTVDNSGAVSYTGMRATGGLRGLPFERLMPAAGGLIACDTFNGNFVLIPRVVFDGLGGVDRRFTHSFADVDLGLRARRLAVPLWLSPDPVGRCDQGVPLKRRRVAGNFVMRCRSLLGEPDGLKTYTVFVWRHRPKLLLPIYVLSRVLAAVRRAMLLSNMEDSEL